MLCCRAVIILSLLLAGCIGTFARTPLNPGRVDVFGVAMYSRIDHREIEGVTGSDEPCLKGFERSFDSLNLAIGYSREGSIRKIATRNAQNSMFGIHPGEIYASAREKAHAAGFVDNGSPYRFKDGDLSLIMLADESGRIFGLVLEFVGD